MACTGIGADSLSFARKIVDDLFACVRGDSLYERPVPQRHRLIFYVGHLEAFDQNLLAGEAGLGAAPAPELDKLFAFGIDPEPGKLPSDGPEEWPGLAAVRDYCARVRKAVDAGWEAAPEQLRHVAIEHRLMHGETLAYLLHNLPHERLLAPGVEGVETGGTIRNEQVEIPGGSVRLGRCPEEGFGWDNEFPALTTAVNDFRIDRWKVTNGEYLEFVRAGAPAPSFWSERKGQWQLRRMFDFVPLPLDWPVYVTQEQAAAYARWRGAALPTEPEWHRAAYGTADGGERAFPWGNAVGQESPGNFDFRRWDPEPVTSHLASASAFGVEGLCGNGWEWTSSPFRPFPGFKQFDWYPGYSEPFFDNEHFVLKGASPRTDGVFLRRSFRNWFRKDYPYVFATFRCLYNNSH